MIYKWFGALLISAFLLSSNNLYAQESNAIKDFIVTLKNGVLLIRIPSQEDALAKLREKGRNQEADERERALNLEIKETLLSFEQTFSFCPVYFFYAKHSEEVRAGQLEGFIFNAQNEYPSKSAIPDNYYTAEFSETPKLGITGLILMDNNLIPLQAPLPHYERKYTLLGIIERSKADMAKAYNQKLWSLYNKYQN